MARYRFYLLNRKWMDRYRLVPGPVRGWIRSGVETSRLLSAAQRRKLRHTFVGLGENIESLYLDNFYSALRRGGAIAILADVTGSPYDAFLEYWNAGRMRSLLSRMLYADQKTYLVELLMKQDRMSMAYID